LGLLDKRDVSLRNLKFGARRRIVNVAPSTGTTTFVRAYEHELRRLDDKLWMSMIAQQGSNDTNKIVAKEVVAWDGSNSQALAFPPYDGEKYHVARISAQEPGEFANFNLCALLGLRALPPTAISGSVARWIERERSIGVPLESPSISDEGHGLMSIKVNTGPISADTFSLDPSHDFAICKVVHLIKNERLVVDDTLEVTEWNRVNGVWMPKRALEKLSDSSKQEYRQETAFELVDISIGTVTQSEVKIEFPVGTKVIDSVRRVDYTINVDGSNRLNPFADLQAGVVYNPTTKTADKIGDDTNKSYETAKIVPVGAVPKSSYSAKRTVYVAISAFLVGVIALVYWSRRRRSDSPSSRASTS